MIPGPFRLKFLLIQEFSVNVFVGCDCNSSRQSHFLLALMFEDGDGCIPAHLNLKIATKTRLLRCTEMSLLSNFAV